METYVRTSQLAIERSLVNIGQIFGYRKKDEIVDKECGKKGRALQVSPRNNQTLITVCKWLENVYRMLKEYSLTFICKSRW